MGCIGRAATVVLACVMAAGAAHAAGQAADFGRESPSTQAREAADWALGSRDHGAMPFAIVDKKAARIFVFDAKGRLRGASEALIGEAPGDAIAPDVGEHAQTGRVPFEERTTPAGRFVSEPGRNIRGEAIIWVDYDSAFAIHRLRPGPSLHDREARLRSPVLSDRRASLGCVVVPVPFYQQVVARVLGRGKAIVYVLPESGDLREMMGSL
jgi:hypothetical protein